MHDADALEAINAEQLVTATDRLLLRGGRPSRRRHARRLAEGSQPHIAIAVLADAGLAWESTVPHPLAPARMVQPYRGHIVAAPFASVPHPRPPARAPQPLYAPVPSLAPRGLSAEPDFDFLDVPSIVSVVHPAPPVRSSHLSYVTAPSTLARGSAPRMPQLAAPRSTRRSQHEPTAVIRRDPGASTQVFAVTVVIPALVGVAVGLAAQL